MHSSVLLVLIVVLAGVVAHAQGNSTNSTFPAPTLTLRTADCLKKLKLTECLGNDVKETMSEAEVTNVLKNTICGSECTNTISQISRTYVESQCGKGARLGMDYELLFPIMPTLNKFTCVTDSQGAMCGALLMTAMKQTGVVNRTIDLQTKRPVPIELTKFPKSFTCSECAAKLQDAARAADAEAKAKSNPAAGEKFWIDSAFPFDDAAVASRKSLCPAGAASATDAAAKGAGGSSSAGRVAGSVATMAAVLVAAASAALL